MQSRRQFVSLPLGLAASAALSSLLAEAVPAPPSSTAGVLFEGFAIPPRRAVQEATITQLKDGRYWLLYGANKQAVGKFSSDHGRTWGEAAALRAADGQGIALCRETPHLSIFRLPSRKLGLIYGGPAARSGRDGTVLFRSSPDEGATWSAPVAVEPLFALCRSGSVRVLRSGRIVAPTIKWISPAAGPESESAYNQFVYTWINYSDDEGMTWQRSLSEVFISLDQSYQGFYSFDEPVLEELDDGRLLMIARTQFGRPYQSISKDGGASWSDPRPVNLGSSDSPHTLIRIPATGHLLLVWNQTSVEENFTGLMRHRLSTAISKDAGVSWVHLRNLESLDGRSHLEPPPPEPKVHLMREWDYHQPTDLKRYPYAPGCLRISYPTATFWKDEAAITYDYGYCHSGELKEGHATKIKIVSLDWLYERV